MRIVNLCGPNPLSPESGGVGGVVYNINKRLVNDGMEIINICYYKENFLKNTEIGTVIGVKVPHNEFLKMITYTLKSAVISRKFEPDIIQSEGGSCFGAGIAAKILNRNKKIIERAHGTHVGLINSMQRKTLHMRILGGMYTNVIEKLTFRNADLIIAVSNLAKRELIKYYKIDPQKIKVIYNGVDTKYYRRNMPKQNARRRLNLDPEDKYSLFVGLDPYRKGIDIAIGATRSVRLSNFKLIIIGKKDLSNQLKSNIIEKLVPVGLVSEKIKRLYYLASDVFIFPSRHEGFALAPLEAMGCGLPVVISKYTGVNEVVKNKEAIVIKNLNGQKYAKEITKIIKNKNYANKLSQKARGLVLKYSWDKVIKKYKLLYSSIKIEK